ncbi:hypothetical protein [Actinomadura rayongensis]|uniref:DNA-binding protein n=1 Tax=Actinomadura rayongensis TaxID=1429076 RepID=A0A6I4WM68_9ACTN|nr:hypothetical protein [Actinomadura rayongensis]MXQ67732.1 hypothetical protein [Actinomadura rayongensis]
MSEQQPAEPESAREPVRGAVAESHDLTASTWINPRDAFAITGLSTPALVYWANQSVISWRRIGRRRQYMREEMVIVAQLGTGRPPHLRSVRTHLAARKKQAKGSA